MPELPQMQALAERLDRRFAGRALEGYEPLGFTGLKTVDPPPEALIGRTVDRVDRRAKYVVLDFRELRVLIHLSQAGRLDIEEQAKRTKPKGSVVRLRFDDGSAILVREHGTERKAGWWILAPGDDGPLEGLGPEPGDDAFRRFFLESGDRRRVHTILRDQRTVSGVGRGYADDALHRAKLSPFASLGSLSPEERVRLVDAVDEVIAEALERERTREGGLSAPKLGEHFTVHGKAGLPCPVCGSDLQRVSYESHEVVYCPTCQTGGKVLADRRLSRIVK
jgi:formamidopyrimidine-DNA glycosylase